MENIISSQMLKVKRPEFKPKKFMKNNKELNEKKY